jgi:hypothetical protein
VTTVARWRARATPRNFLNLDTSSAETRQNTPLFSFFWEHIIIVYLHSSRITNFIIVSLTSPFPSQLPSFYSISQSIDSTIITTKTMNITQRGRFWMLAIASLLLVIQTRAFQLQPRTLCSKTSRLSTTTALGVAEKKPRWTELPRSREKKPELAGFEINTGRLAMIGFCGLLATEIVSGQSFGEQFVLALSSASGSNLPI